ncbi:hypothetical protein [Methanoregula sp.]|jgi:hypothetical protein|uniref:hypothetical protein n=1 Tax=Methanoregula sp. TaxID=2052170 RepID=UPI0026180F98|nr:hypothetical protein [Methanoregula sp.]MDD5142210.1 hypothetical protein [Methanoregula sp.]
MDLLTFLILVLILVVVLFLVYWFFHGAKGNIALTRPVESRVDEYLDRRFHEMIAEWELVPGPQLRRFTEERSRDLAQEEARLGELKQFESGMRTTLSSLEARLDTLEKELEGSAAKK